ncbi:MAG: FecR family protein [Deltaproteobacteria bacterium]|nr:FecR family protein [Deltaproteobacteria bacterium]
MKLLALGLLALTLGCKDEPADQPEPEPKLEQPAAEAAVGDQPQDRAKRRYTIESLSGKVDVSGGAGAVGQSVGGGEAVRTGKGASVTLRIDDVAIRVEEDSLLTARQVTDEVAEVELDRGRARATVAGGERAVRVRSKGSTAVAETGEGEFSVFNDGRGTVAVASRKGKIKFGSSKGDSVLAAGQRGVVTGERAPQIAAIPREVLLEVNWPGARKKVELRGHAEPGAAVRVNGNSVETGPDGAFTASLILEPGDNSIEVSALDLSGRQRTVKRVIKVRERAPEVRANTKDIWRQ